MYSNPGSFMTKSIALPDCFPPTRHLDTYEKRLGDNHEALRNARRVEEKARVRERRTKRES
jgi:hypothetical protein